MTRMIIFDDGKGSFGPMTDLRAAFEVRTGMLTTAGRIAAWRPRTLAGYWVPEALRAAVAERADAPVNILPDEEQLLCLNGRWALPERDFNLGVGEALVEEGTGETIAAHLRRADAERFLESGALPERVRQRTAAAGALYRFPWDVLNRLPQVLVHDITSTRILDAKVLGTDVAVMGYEPVEVHASAMLGPNVVFDGTRGPIIVHERAVIRPGAVLCGPCSIGRESVVVDHAIIKPNTAIGPVCKVGGEVGATIFQGYSNKAHEGHLGDSWVGKWVNLGAGTTNSNLLNTYGEVTMRLDAKGSRMRTGRQFMGAIIGDHVKTAIGTRLMTGTVLGTGAMIASSTPPPDLVEPFTWLTDAGMGRYRLNKFIEVMKAVMARREKVAGEGYLKRIEVLHSKASGA
jgi:UDP-N-acetylglucosamine diphosphorylase/glucosamine-1-phosphate N-acetyltransferase